MAFIEMDFISGGGNSNISLEALIPTLTGTDSRVLTDSTYSSNYVGWYAFDGKLTTHWASASGNHYIGFDLGESKSIEFFVLYSQEGGSTTVKIQGASKSDFSDSVDLTPSLNYGNGTLITNPVLNTLKNKNFRYVRAMFNGSTTNNTCMFQVYGY